MHGSSAVDGHALQQHTGPCELHNQTMTITTFAEH